MGELLSLSLGLAYIFKKSKSRNPNEINITPIALIGTNTSVYQYCPFNSQHDYYTERDKR